MHLILMLNTYIIEFVYIKYYTFLVPNNNLYSKFIS